MVFLGSMSASILPSSCIRTSPLCRGQRRLFSKQIYSHESKNGVSRRKFLSREIALTAFCSLISEDSVRGMEMPSTELEASFILKKASAEVSNELKGTSIFLVGMNCTLKSNMGKVLADILKYYYFDSDSVVEQATIGDPASKSFQDKNDETFRESESEVLKQLSTMGRLIVCVGDSAVQCSTNLAFLRDGISLWIDVPLDIIANEVSRAEVSHSGFGTHQDNDLLLKMDALTTRYNEFKGGYGTADATVSLLKVASDLGYDDLSLISPEDMAVQALKEIERLTRLKKMMEAAARPF